VLRLFLSPKTKGGDHVKDIPIIPHGIVGIEFLGEAEQRSFYAAMLVRILALYRAEQEGVQ
jgi:hypothetical protein